LAKIQHKHQSFGKDGQNLYESNHKYKWKVLKKNHSRLAIIKKNIPASSQFIQVDFRWFSSANIIRIFSFSHKFNKFTYG
jgi:hypothetical protein